MHPKTLTRGLAADTLSRAATVTLIVLAALLDGGRARANSLRRTIAVLAACLAMAGAATVNAQTSTNANLSDVSVFVGSTQQILSPTFAAATTSYDVTVANNATQVYFTAVTAHSGATLDYLDASDTTLTDADTNVSGFQHNIIVGANVVKLKVTAEDTTTTKTYTFTVIRLGPLTACSAASMEDQMWTGTLTVGEVIQHGVTQRGWSTSVTLPGGTLSDTDFSFDGDMYEIAEISTFGGLLGLAFSGTGMGDIATQATRDKLVFHVGNSSFNLGDGALASNQRSISWSTNVPTWSQYDRVCLALTEVDETPPAIALAQVNADAAVQLLFDEALDSTSVADKSAFTVTVERTSRTVDSVSLSPDGTRITLVVIPAIRPGESIDGVRYTAPGTDPLKDEAGNEVGTFNVLNVPNNLAATAPDAPRNLTARANGADSIILSWETPWANGDDITKFQARYVTGSNPGGTFADIDGSNATTTTYTVTELTAGREYTFEVRAVNGEGNGAEATVTRMTATPAWELTISDSNDAAVTELVEGGASATVTVRITNAVTFSTAQTVTLNWDGGALDATNRIQGAGGASAITISPGQSSGTLVISAPDPGGVAAHDPPHTAPLRAMHGENPLGSIDLTLRDDEAPPVATLTAEASQVSEGGTIDVEIRLNPPFGASATSTIGLAVTDADGALVGPLPSEAVFDSGELTHAFTLTAADNAVQNDDAREVTVALVVNPDASPYTLGAPSSVTVTVRDNDTPPSAPRSLTAEAGDGQVRLRWMAPATDNGQAVTGYGYRQKEGTGSFGAWTDITGSNVNTIEYTVGGLTNGIDHTFEVRAENPAGWSAESNQARTTPGAADTTAPMLQGATTTALALALFYDEDLDAGSEPAPSAFTVTVDGVPRGVTGVALDETDVLLTLASAVRAGETVRVSYTVPMTGRLQDEASNPAAAFANHLVTNIVSATAPEAPGNLAAAPEPVPGDTVAGYTPTGWCSPGIRRGTTATSSPATRCATSKA